MSHREALIAVAETFARRDTVIPQGVSGMPKSDWERRRLRQEVQRGPCEQWNCDNEAEGTCGTCATTPWVATSGRRYEGLVVHYCSKHLREHCERESHTPIWYRFGGK